MAENFSGRENPTAENIFARGGEMGARMRSMDWSKTPLGAVESWSQALRTSVSICLNSRFPMVIWWGRELVLLYNDGWRPILGTNKDKFALGNRGEIVWAEIWDVLGPMFAQVLDTGEATWNDDGLLLVNRYGFTEEAYFTWSYSPISDDDGSVGGVFTAVTETTQRVIGERRLQTLRDLGERSLAEAKSAEEACRAACETLTENPYDFPFALIYLLDEDGKTARLAEAIRLEIGSPAAPEICGLEPSANPQSDDVWSLKLALETKSSVKIESLAEKFGRLTAGAWTDDATKEAFVVPLAKTGVQEFPAGFIVCGISPRLRFDDDYRSFLELAAGHTATAIANARALEAERKRAEALAELDRAKTEFFSNVSHEFRTPLTLMLGNLEEVLRKDENLSSSEREQIETAQRNSLRLLKLVNNLLDFSRIEAGKAATRFEPTDLARLTAELASNFRAGVEKAGISLKVNCPPLSQSIAVDREMWEKIVLNLLSNAFKFTMRGEIEVALSETGKAVELKVRDTGVGIPANELPNIFERFHRVGSTQGRTHEGTGIGLSLVQELVKLHDGAVSVESELGKGTCFTITIPKTGKGGAITARRENALNESDTVAQPREDWRSYLLDSGETALSERKSDSVEPALLPFYPSAKILLADDNADMRGYISRLLTESGYSVEAVGDGQAALERLRNPGAENPDLVLTDVMMPRMNGFELLATIRKDGSLREIPVIMLSARAGEESKIEGFEAGADDYLIKPFSARELLARVGSVIELTRMRRTAENRAILLAEISNLTRRFENPQNLLYEVTKAVGEHLEVRRCLFNEIDLENDLEIVHRDYCRGVPSVAGKHKVSAYSPVTSGEMIAGRTVVNRDSKTDSRTADLYDQIYAVAGERAYIAVPLLRENRWVASLWVSDDKPRDWSKEEVNLLEFIAEQVWAVVEKLRIDAALRESEKRFRNMADHAPVMIWVTDATGYCHYLSQSWYKFTGQTPETGLGFGWLEATHPDDAKRAEEIFLAANAKHAPFRLEYRLRRQDGEYRWAIDSAQPRFGENGEFLGYIGSVIDITERKLAEQEREKMLARETVLREEAEKANRLKDEFLATVSHELRTPLNSMLGWAAMVRQNNYDAEIMRRAFEIVERNARNQNQIISDILDVSRIITGKLNLNLQPLQLSSAILAAIDTLRPAIEAKGITLATSFETDVEKIAGDADRLQQIVWNVLSNAVKFTPAKGLIEIALSYEKDYAEIKVADNGSGIEPDFLPFVFDRFRQADGRTNRKHGGLGLGLAIVRHLTELHGGSVSAKSQGIGKGAIFTIRFPLKYRSSETDANDFAGELEAETTLPPDHGSRSLLDGLKILVVDDEPDALELVSFILNEQNAQVFTADSVDSALDIYETVGLDAVISDIGMPEKDGLELIREIKSRANGQTPSLALTAYAREEDSRQVLQAGFDAYLPKPVEPSKLIETIIEITRD